MILRGAKVCARPVDPSVHRSALFVWSAPPRRRPLARTQVGDQIEVLAEEQGPDGRYLMARNPATGQVGLYLNMWVRHPERGVPEGNAA